MKTSGVVKNKKKEFEVSFKGEVVNTLTALSKEREKWIGGRREQKFYGWLCWFFI